MADVRRLLDTALQGDVEAQRRYLTEMQRRDDIDGLLRLLEADDFDPLVLTHLLVVASGGSLARTRHAYFPQRRSGRGPITLPERQYFRIADVLMRHRGDMRYWWTAARAFVPHATRRGDWPLVLLFGGETWDFSGEPRINWRADWMGHRDDPTADQWQRLGLALMDTLLTVIVKWERLPTHRGFQHENLGSLLANPVALLEAMFMVAADAGVSLDHYRVPMAYGLAALEGHWEQDAPSRLLPGLFQYFHEPPAHLDVDWEQPDAEDIWYAAEVAKEDAERLAQMDARSVIEGLMGAARDIWSQDADMVAIEGSWY